MGAEASVEEKQEKEGINFVNEDVLPPSDLAASMGVKATDIGGSATIVGNYLVITGQVGLRDPADESAIALVKYTKEGCFWQHITLSGPYFDFHAGGLVGDAIYMCGGKDTRDIALTAEVWRLDLVMLEWQRCMTYGRQPPELIGHTVEVLDESAQLIVFGGIAIGTDSIQNELWVLQTDNMRWVQPVTKGTSPQPSVMHTSCLAGQRVFIWGGATSESLDAALNDLHLLDCENGNFTWSQPMINGSLIPPCLAAASMSYFKGRCLLLGGFDSDNRRRSTMYAYSIREICWYEFYDLSAHLPGMQYTLRKGSSSPGPAMSEISFHRAATFTHGIFVVSGHGVKQENATPGLPTVMVLREKN